MHPNEKEKGVVRRGRPTSGESVYPKLADPPLEVGRLRPRWVLENSKQISFRPNKRLSRGYYKEWRMIRVSILSSEGGQPLHENEKGSLGVVTQSITGKSPYMVAI